MNPFEVLNNPTKYKELFLSTFKRIVKPSNAEEKALFNKIDWMIDKKDFNSTVRMLCSFNRGTKRIKGRYKWGTIGWNGKKEAEGIDSPHGYYESLGKNDGKGHFRWDFGELYTLSPKSLEKIQKFIKLLKLDEL